MRIAVIGAGPAGMTAAYQLSRSLGKGVDAIDVYECSREVGGLSRTIELWGQQVDLGPHRFFSHDPEINALWQEVTRDAYDLVDRQTRIYYKKRFFDYPIKALNALSGLGLFEATRCVLSYIRERLRRNPDTSDYEGWISNRFGKRLYHIFFKTYSEKLWGIPCSELDADFAAQRIKKLSLFEAVKSALIPDKKTRHATLVDRFAYPRGGTGSVYKSMQTVVESRGGKVYTETAVKRVLVSQGHARGIELRDGTEKSYDHVVSTMPLSLMVKGLPDLSPELEKAVGKLRYRNTILVYLRVANSELFTDQWLYIHEPSVTVGRVTNFRNWSPSVYGDSKDSVLCLEYWCNFGDKRWEQPDQELIDEARKEIVKTGLVEAGEILEGSVFRLPRCYPVYYAGYRSDLAPIEAFLSEIKGLHVIGRYGAYKYNNQDHSILMGIRLAENLLTGSRHSLWKINTDYEVYQESSSLEKSGLNQSGNEQRH